jgi:hypothetical protein
MSLAKPRKYLLLSIGILSACQPASSLLSGDDTAFFANSLRRAPLADEPNVQAILQMKMGCTGYFVGSSLGQVLVMTANHCVDHKPAEWCADINNYAFDQAGNLRRCQRLIVGEASSDLLLFEFDGPPPPATLALLEDGAVQNRRLVMYGYPVDMFARSGMNVTENCWITGKRDASRWEEYTHDTGFLHNCSTYGGNSGGPMVVENSRAVVGQPSTYFRDVFTNYASDGETTAWGSDMTSFIRRNRSALRGVGAEIVSSPLEAPQLTPSALTVRSGTYSAPNCLREYSTAVRAQYHTNATLTALSVRWSQSDGASMQAHYVCSGDTCTQDSETPNTLFKIRARDEIEYLGLGQESGCLLKLSQAGYY